MMIAGQMATVRNSTESYVIYQPKDSMSIEQHSEEGSEI